MPQIPLPEGVVGSERLPHTRRTLTNCFNNGEGQIISRPGIDQLASTGKVARGQFVWNDSLYQVVSNSLIKITDTETGAFTTNATAISGNPNVVTAIGFNHAVILVPGGDIYTLDSSDVVTLISGGANFVPSDWVTHIDGRFVYIPTSGDPAFFSDVGAAGTVQAASFFDAEELPDKNEVAFNLNNTLYIAGTDSIELFRNTGASPNPFARLTGARISAGYVGGLIEYNKTFFFIGRLKDQGFGIFAVGQGDAPKISNTTIDLILTGYNERELSQAVGARFNWRGYDIITFTLGHDSFGYYNGNWFFLNTLVNNNPVPWNGGFITQLGGEYFTANDGSIGKLSLSNFDYGVAISKVIDIGFEQEDGDFFTCQNIGVDISQGYINPNVKGAFSGGFSKGFSVGIDYGPRTVGLFMTRDNVTYGNGVYKEVGEIGQYSKHLEWNEAGGLGMYNGFMGIRLVTAQNVDFSVDKMFANFR